MKNVLFLALAAASLSFTSCGSKQETAAKKEGDAVEATANAQAASLDAKSDSVKKAGAATADAIKDNAGKATTTTTAPAAGTTTTTTTEVKK